MKKHHIFSPVSFLIFMIAMSTVYYFCVPLGVKNYILTDTFVGKWLGLSRISLKKAFNIVHLPYWFGKSELPVLYFDISKKNEEEMIDGLPFDQETLSYRSMLDEDKTYVKADFLSPADGYKEEIKIRFRGMSPSHWNAGKKSYRVKFNKDNLFQGMSNLDLIIPDDRLYFMEMLSSYRAKKLGLFSLEFKFVKVVINGFDYGVYLAVEPWSKELLARNRIMDTNNIFSTKDISDEVEPKSIFKTSMLSDWKSYTNEEATSFDELKVLLALLENADDKEFALKIGTLIDLEKFYRWQLVYALAGSSHVTDSSNFVLMFSQETGKFEFLPFDVAAGSFYPYDFTPTLVKRMLADEEILKGYKRVVNDYVSNENNLKDDLAYYDELYQKYFGEFYRDQEKLDSDYVFDKKIKTYRAWSVDNFYSIKGSTANLSPADFVLGETNYSKKPIVFEGSFKYFNDIFTDIDRFVDKNPQFLKKDQRTVVLNSGTHIFTQNTIIPKSLKLIIEPGATLLLAPKVSIISYSPVYAVANADLPITITGLYPNEPWGSFGVINTGKEKNYFNFIYVSGGFAWGGSTTGLMNGVLLTSQFSLHNSNSEIYNSIFENGHSDDTFHAVLGSVVIRNSIFRNASSDALDLDAVKNSKVLGNRFYNENINQSGNDGDGIDISGSENLEVSDNRISNFGDKCISIGEEADVITRNNILIGCNYGIAVKDGSRVTIDNSIIIGNRTGGITLYRKKQEFISGGNAEVTNSILWGNAKEIAIDEITVYPTKSGESRQIEKQGVSTLSIKDSTVQGGYGGTNIKTDRPDFSHLLPANIVRSLNL